MNPRSRRTMTIGAVLRATHEEFPDLTVSKVRFLEAEGLLAPERTPSGYRVYTGDDVERLRYVLRAQRDRFWPLKVIRESLEALDRGLEPPTGDGTRPTPPPARPDPDVPTAAELGRRRTVRLTRNEVAEAAGCPPGTVEALVSFGLLRPVTGQQYDDTAVAVARAAGELAAYGMEPRHLRPFRTAADREIGLVRQAVAPLPRDPKERAAREAQVLRACIALHAALVKAGLREPG